MVKINCKVKAKHNYKRIEQLKKKLPEIINESIEKVVKNIQGCAIKLEKGNNKEGILIELIEGSTGKVKKRVYADPSKFMSNGQSYLWFEYFGTGQYAEQDHVGKTKHFIESGYTEWFIPVSKVDRTLNYPIVTINDVQFYISHGVRPNRFLQDAEFETREDNKEIVIETINDMLREVCK